MCTVQCTVISLCSGLAVSEWSNRFTSSDIGDGTHLSSILGRGEISPDSPVILKGISQEWQMFPVFVFTLSVTLSGLQAVSWVNSQQWGPGQVASEILTVTQSNSLQPPSEHDTGQWSSGAVNTNSEYQWSVWACHPEVNVSSPPSVRLMNGWQCCVFLAWSGAVCLNWFWW